MTGFFDVTVTLTTPTVVATLTYGDKESIIMTSAAPRRPAWPSFGVWEWETASGRPKSTAAEDQFVILVAVVQRVVDRLGAALIAMLPIIAAADPTTREVIEGARALRKEAWLIEERDREHRAAMTRAADAFRAGRFDEVVEILVPYADCFTPAERARVEYARRRMRS